MRKITKEVVEAFFSWKDYRKGNTTVCVAFGRVEMRLFGHMIAYNENFKNKGVFITNAGWPTNTTKERLNGILEHMGISKIYQKDFAWYWKDGKVFKNSGFVEVTK